MTRGARVREVYIQQDRGTYVAPCGFTCHEGFRFLGSRVHVFEEPVLSSLPLTRETLVHGWVRTVQAALRQIGAPVPPPLDYPDELREYLASPVCRGTLRDVRGIWNWHPVPMFVKPVEQKLFTGHTVERFSDLAETASLPDETPVWTARTVRFRSEYRVFVHEDRIRGMKHYNGNPWTVPDQGVVLQMIRDYTPSAPIAYGLDVGVTDEGRTCLVEVNDCYALGSYGLSAVTYAEMVEDRWMQMVTAPTAPLETAT